MTGTPPHHVVIVGAGFGGLAVAHGLAGAHPSGLRITVVDQRNHHLFQPLLYQVGTAVLATSEIAWPIRHLLRRRKDVTTLLAVVDGVDPVNRRVQFEDGGSVGYDTLVLATGARHAYFGHDEWEPHAPGLKTLEDATSISRLARNAGRPGGPVEGGARSHGPRPSGHFRDRGHRHHQRVERPTRARHRARRETTGRARCPLDPPPPAG